MLITTKSPDFYLFQKLVVGVSIRWMVVCAYVRGTKSFYLNPTTEKVECLESFCYAKIHKLMTILSMTPVLPPENKETRWGYSRGLTTVSRLTKVCDERAEAAITIDLGMIAHRIDFVLTFLVP